MIRAFLPPAFWVCLLLFLVHQLLQKVLAVSLPFLDSYLDPFLCIPIILPLLALERHYLLGLSYFNASDPGDAAIVTVALSVIFEVGFPTWSSSFVQDKYDFVAYAAGYLFWYLTIWRGRASRT